MFSDLIDALSDWLNCFFLWANKIEPIAYLGYRKTELALSKLFIV